jgi:hypothetical protein
MVLGWKVEEDEESLAILRQAAPLQVAPVVGRGLQA